MARIEFKDVAHSYLRSPARAEDYALQPMNLAWQDGGAYALLGPSGSGKTTLLNIISGLLRPSGGRVLFDGRDVTGSSTVQRNIAQVFQFPVIYDTMTVFDNLAFPLRNRGVAEAEVRSRVAQVAEMLELGDDLRRRARGLAADAKQKVSLGRGLVRSDVGAILFDEPLTVIDPHLKWRLRRKLKEIHKRYRLTLIYVTHDQGEALTFADRVVVMHEGRVLQEGTPQELFETPMHRFVGYFIGSPGMNFLPCRLSAGGAEVAGRHVPLAATLLAKARDAGTLELGVRPEAIDLTGDGGRGLAVQVRDVEDLGTRKIATCRLGEHEIKVVVPPEQPVPADRGTIELNPAMTRLYADGHLVG
jgi:glycerol transport system ATP-binding protein